MHVKVRLATVNTTETSYKVVAYDNVLDGSPLVIPVATRDLYSTRVLGCPDKWQLVCLG